jgi:hypothetical protein
VHADEADGAAGVAAAQERDQAPVLLVRADQHLLRMRDARDQVAHLPLHLGHGGHDPGRMGGLGHADVEADVGAPVLVERAGDVHPVGQLEQPVEVLVTGPLRGEHGGAGLNGDAIVEHRAGLLPEHLGLHVLPERRPVRDEGAAGAAAQRHQVTALHERRERLTQGGAGDAQLVGQVAFRRQAAARHQQAEPDRGAEPLHGLFEGRGRMDRLEYGLQGGRPFRPCHGMHISKGTPTVPLPCRYER